MLTREMTLAHLCGPSLVYIIVRCTHDVVSQLEVLDPMQTLKKQEKTIRDLKQVNESHAPCL